MHERFSYVLNIKGWFTFLIRFVLIFIQKRRNPMNDRFGTHLKNFSYKLRFSILFHQNNEIFHTQRLIAVCSRILKSFSKFFTAFHRINDEYSHRITKKNFSWMLREKCENFSLADLMVETFRLWNLNEKDLTFRF